jgi:hypothetical protein
MGDTLIQAVGADSFAIDFSNINFLLGHARVKLPT